MQEIKVSPQIDTSRGWILDSEIDALVAELKKLDQLENENAWRAGLDILEQRALKRAHEEKPEDTDWTSVVLADFETNHTRWLIEKQKAA